MQETFAIRLKKALELRNMKPAELSEKSEVPKSAISQYLSGKYEAKQRTLYKISEILDVSEGWLMGLDVPIIRNDQQEFDNNVTPIRIKDSADKIINVPIYGKIPAGVPMEAIEEIIDYEEIVVKPSDHRQYFGLELDGNSMYPDYKDKDHVIFVQKPDCDSGDDCAVMVNGDDATFKKVLKQESGILLQPMNPEFEPMFYTRKDIAQKPVRILGVACQIIRKIQNSSCNN